MRASKGENLRRFARSFQVRAPQRAGAIRHALPLGHVVLTSPPLVKTAPFPRAMPGEFFFRTSGVGFLYESRCRRAGANPGLCLPEPATRNVSGQPEGGKHGGSHLSGLKSSLSLRLPGRRDCGAADAGRRCGNSKARLGVFRLPVGIKLRCINRNTEEKYGQAFRFQGR